MAKNEYDRAPVRLKVRELKMVGKTLVTTLLYKNRWHIEMDFKNINTTIGIVTLGCRTPSLLEKAVR
jgi:IS4 transposase